MRMTSLPMREGIRSAFIAKTTNNIVEKMIGNPLNVYNTLNERSNMLIQSDIQCLGDGKTIVFTTKQQEDVENFKNSLKNGATEYAFDGTLLEGEAFLRGLMQIVQVSNH